MKASLSPILSNMKSSRNVKTIIYVKTKEIATVLWKMMKLCGPSETRKRAKDDFRDGAVNTVIATIGFGMVGVSLTNITKNFIQFCLGH